MDSKLLALVEEHGPRNWTVIGAIMSLTGKQCRERVLNGLAPHKRGAWTQEEDRLLFELQNVFGNKWAQIARLLDGRTENNVKNRWHSLKRKAERTDQRYHWTAAGEQSPSCTVPKRARSCRESFGPETILFNPYIPHAPDIRASFLPAVSEGLVASSQR